MSSRRDRFPATNRDRLALSTPVASAICSSGKPQSMIACLSTSVIGLLAAIVSIVTKETLHVNPG